MEYVLKIRLTEEAYRHLERVRKIVKNESSLRMAPKMLGELTWFLNWFRENRDRVEITEE